MLLLLPALAADADDRIRWSALPNLSYDSDDKLGFGARGQLDVLRPGFDPYRASYVVHIFATTNGYHHHRFRFDLVGLGAGQDLRLTGHFAYRAWLNDGYWGIGNGTVASPDDEYHRYALVQPFGHLTLRSGTGLLSVYGAVEGRYTRVRADPGSLLAEEAPWGIDGGPAAQAGAGVLVDTREPEITPDRGVLVEVSGRLVGYPLFGGPFLSARGWIGVPRVVSATRLMGEYLLGEVPFYEMVHWGGFVPIAGFGGADTLRGAPFGRWRGPGKVVLNEEIRIDVVRHPFLGEELRWQVIPFADAGMVHQPGDPSTPPHYTAGLGVRPIWGETLVGRLDTAIGWSPTACGVGCVEMVPTWGFYLMFDHLF